MSKKHIKSASSVSDLAYYLDGLAILAAFLWCIMHLKIIHDWLQHFVQ